MNPASSSSAVAIPLVLCIDDGQVALRVRKLVLTNAGYNVLTADSVEEGLALFKQYPVELVIADHFLSGTTGTELAKVMKKLKAEVPILIVSGAMDPPAGLEFTDGFLTKCQPPDVLLDMIARLLAK
ncbi:MAG: response regulator [Candidatus Korobacteraceae bacterium]